jgi:hypothetical protein
MPTSGHSIIEERLDALTFPPGSVAESAVRLGDDPTQAIDVYGVHLDTGQLSDVIAG